MVTRPYFMSNENWYTMDEDGNIVLTKSAPEKAVLEYNQFKKDYNDRVKKLKTKDDVIDFFMSEEHTFSFPLDEESEALLKNKYNG